jgi:AcrR family transcriptional regulator
VRTEQAQRTRARVVQAARGLFLDRGFAATTIASVAEAAAVAPETVYAAFGSKARLLEAVVLAAVLRDDEADEPLDRRWFHEVLQQPDLRAQLAALARHTAETTALTSPIYTVMRAAGTDTGELEQLQRRLRDYRFNGQAQLIAKIADAGSLRPDVSLEDAAVTFSALASPELHHLLTADRGWSQTRYSQWLHRTVETALLEDRDSQR